MARARTFYEEGAKLREKRLREELLARRDETEATDDCGAASHGRYVQGCRCRACREANAAYERERKIRRTREECGAPTMWVDAEPVRRTLVKLYAQGYTAREIERLSGVGHTQQYQIVHRHWRTGKPVKRVLRKTKDALMAMRGGRRSLTAGQRVDASWMAGWVREYAERGLSVAEMSRTCGVDRQTLDALRHGRRKAVQARTLHAFVAAKPELDRKVGRYAEQR